MRTKLVLMLFLVGFVSQVNAAVVVSGNEVRDFDFQNYGSLAVAENGTANIIGGSFSGEIQIWDNGTVNMSSGSLNIENSSWMHDLATMTITGGMVTCPGRLSITGDSKLFLSGTNFSVGGVSVEYGELDLDYLLSQGALAYEVDESERWIGTISGILDDGQSFNLNFSINHFLYGDTPKTANIVLVPEPASLLLLSIGGFLSLRKK